MSDHKIGCLPVVSGDQLLGMLTETDVLRLVAGSDRDPADEPVGAS